MYHIGRPVPQFDSKNDTKGKIAKGIMMPWYWEGKKRETMEIKLCQHYEAKNHFGELLSDPFEQ